MGKVSLSRDERLGGLQPSTKFTEVRLRRTRHRRPSPLQSARASPPKAVPLPAVTTRIIPRHRRVHPRPPSNTLPPHPLYYAARPAAPPSSLTVLSVRPKRRLVPGHLLRRIVRLVSRAHIEEHAGCSHDAM